MRLYLSSYRLGNVIDRLHELARGGKRTAIIRNAMDNVVDPDFQKADRVRETTMLKSAGFAPETLDLREYFGKPGKLEQRLRQFDIVWIRGGNVFVLRRAMQASGFDRSILRLLKEDAIVYAGYSAAGCVLSPSLRGYAIVDDSSAEPAGYPPGAIWDGLGVLAYTLLPHYKSDHPESAGIDKELALLKTQGVPYKTLHDGQAVIREGSTEEVAG